MKKVVIFIFPFLLNAQSYEDKFYRDKNYHPSRIGIHSDISYSSYMVELHSSEFNSAIDYDIIDFTLGVSFSYDKWMWGLSSKFVMDALQSNMNVVPSGEKRNDYAEINKKEFTLYANYTLYQNERDALRANGIYRYAKLDAQDSYLSYYNYQSLFKYKTQGVALSLIYSRILTEKSSGFFNLGVVYSYANVEMSESIEDRLQDSYVDDSSSAVGVKISVGYNHKISSNLFFNIRVDGWQSNFGELKVTSRVGDNLPNASLKEQIFTLHTGLTWHFE